MEASEVNVAATEGPRSIFRFQPAFASAIPSAALRQGKPRVESATRKVFPNRPVRAHPGSGCIPDRAAAEGTWVRVTGLRVRSPVAL